jgi:SAM-dependent methyltransferase
LSEEDSRLAAAWDRYSAEHLEDYLVSGVEDPRINAQSILTRALVIDMLYPGQFTELIDAELRFGVVLTWLLRELEAHRDRCGLLDEIATPVSAAVPAVVRETYAWLQSPTVPVQDYISMALDPIDPDQPAALLNLRALDTFMDHWRRILPETHPGPVPKVLEVACGSANDYRFFCRCGLASRIDYTGLDVSSKNIDNARRLCPGGHFVRGSILSSGLGDAAFDCVFFHDLLEHLSAEAVSLAVKEMSRLTRRELWSHLFRATPAPGHTITPSPPYHWNTLSVPTLVATLSANGLDADAFFIGDWLAKKFNFTQPHNSLAATILATKRG